LIKKDAAEEKMGGLYLPTGVHKNHTGTVIGVGPGKYSDRGVLLPIDLKVGDRVIFNQHGGQTVKVDNDEVTIFYDHDIYAVME
jgi:chaperonin GroES